ncbi:Peroxiredoxin [Methanimicrococcus hongohii]|uniref:Peroxiredoxin n=1 Tax=Methanimicrococcus hongohii TaxID=3028295 RepID=A0AA96VC05_9EURY|nr:peroxiredoxin [Methanimicrococcus sp. Hf6]WNY24107.1 Peroxiredoxin [Methanimicrococcus sp. Hf6]
MTEEYCDCWEYEEPASLPLIGDEAPEFEAQTTNGQVKFPADYKGKWVILFSHPADFTPVCTTEFITFATMEDEFKKLNTELIGLSIDSITSHIAWLKEIKDNIKYQGLEGVEIKFPVIADIKMEVAKKYGMLQPGASDTKAVRAVFIINPKGIVKAILYYPLSAGRNMGEIKRLLQALQVNEKDGVSTPANWMPGDDVVIGAPETFAGAQERDIWMNDGDKTVHSWFLVTKKQK